MMLAQKGYLLSHIPSEEKLKNLLLRYSGAGFFVDLFLAREYSAPTYGVSSSFNKFGTCF